MADKRIMSRLRGFTSLLLAATGLLVAVSGVLLFFAPGGREARLTGWSALGMDRWRWAVLHVDFIWFFLGAIVLHIAINWKTLYNHLRRRSSSGIRPTWALGAVLLLVGLLLSASFLDVPPFGRQGRWAQRGMQGRKGHPRHRMLRSHHAHLRIDDLARQYGLEPARARALLAAAGYPSQAAHVTVGDLAVRFGARPRAILDVLRQAVASPPEQFGVRDRGRMRGHAR